MQKSYKIEITKSAEKQLRKLSDSVSKKISIAILSLAENPRPNGCKKLKGKDLAYRIRVSDYRIIYEVFDNELLIVVLAAGHRKEIYN